MGDKITKEMKKEALWAVHTLMAAEQLIHTVDGSISNAHIAEALDNLTGAMESISKDFKL